MLHWLQDIHLAVLNPFLAAVASLIRSIQTTILRMAAVVADACFVMLLLCLQVSGDLVGGWTERVAMRRCLSPDGCLGASKGERICMAMITAVVRQQLSCCGVVYSGR
jgi:hypothetical protein